MQVYCVIQYFLCFFIIGTNIITFRCYPNLYLSKEINAEEQNWFVIQMSTFKIFFQTGSYREKFGNL